VSTLLLKHTLQTVSVILVSAGTAAGALDAAAATADALGLGSPGLLNNDLLMGEDTGFPEASLTVLFALGFSPSGLTDRGSDNALTPRGAFAATSAK